VVVVVRRVTTILIDLPVMVVPVVVVLVVELRIRLTVVKKVQVQRVRDTTVPDRELPGTPQVVAVPVVRVTVETAKVVKIL
jgi:hypothetical protein